MLINKGYKIKKLAVLLLSLLLICAGCQLKPAWESFPEKPELQIPVAAPEATAEPPRFDMMEYIDGELGGGHFIDGNTLRLGRDVVLSAPVYFYDCGDISIDLNGFHISADQSFFGGGAEKAWFMVFDGGRAHIYSSVSGGGIDCSAYGRIAGITAIGHTALIIDNAEISVSSAQKAGESGFGSCCVYVTDGAYVQIDGGTFNGDCGIFAEDPAQEGTTVLINGGGFGGDASLFGAYFKDTATIIINNGSFSGTKADIYAEGNPIVTVYNASYDLISDSRQSGWQPVLAGMMAQRAEEQENAAAQEDGGSLEDDERGQE